MTDRTVPTGDPTVDDALRDALRTIAEEAHVTVASLQDAIQDALGKHGPGVTITPLRAELRTAHIKDAAASVNVVAALIRGTDSAKVRAAREVGDRVTAQIAAQIALDETFRVPNADAVAATISDLVVYSSHVNLGEDLLDAVAPLWTAEKARAELNLSRASMAGRRKTGSLLGLRTTDGDFFYPVSQFERTSDGVRVKPALRPFLMALREHDPWTVAIMLNTKADELDGKTPLEWARAQGEQQTLTDYAAMLDAEWSR